MTTTVQPPIQRTHQIVGTRHYSYPVSKATYDLIEARWGQERKPSNPELVTLLTQLLDEVMSGTPAIVDPAVPMATETPAPATTVDAYLVYEFGNDAAARRGWCGVARQCLQEMGIDVYAPSNNRGRSLPIRDVINVARRFGRSHGVLDGVDRELQRFALDHGLPALRAF